MLNFYEFCMLLEQRQMHFFQTRARELYHGSNSGPNDSIAQSFMTKGAQSGAASGHGQGAGFYVWSDAASAKKHSTTEAGEGVSKTEMGGSPMIVIVETVLEPDKWDLDYETNSHTVAKWLFNNWDTVKDDLGEVINLDKSKGALTSGGGVSGLTGEQVPVKKAIHLAIDNPTGGSRRSNIPLDKDSSDSSIGTGEKLGIVMNALSTGKNNALMHKFEERFFANMPAGIGVKYTGGSPLAVKRIEILKDGQWVDFSTH